MCLTLKLLQIQPDKDIIIEYIKNDEFKYVRMLGERASACDPCAGLMLRTVDADTVMTSQWNPGVLRH